MTRSLHVSMTGMAPKISKPSGTMKFCGFWLTTPSTTRKASFSRLSKRPAENSNHTRALTQQCDGFECLELDFMYQARDPRTRVVNLIWISQ